jgi:putative toxin-antitoxin system antitoxin component (TIGR02293 family)
METDVIAEVLGGRSVLRKDVKKAEDLTEIVRKGLPAIAIKKLAARLEIGSTALSDKLGIPRRTLTRRLGHRSRLTASESDRAVRLARLYAIAVETFGDPKKAVGWLRTPNRVFGGERPIDKLDTDIGARAVEDVLGRIAYGVYS